MKKLLVMLTAVVLSVTTLCAKELTDSKYHEYLDRMDFLGSLMLGEKISEDVLVETRINNSLVYQVFYDSNSKWATVKVSNLELHNKEMQKRGITDNEQFIIRVIQFYLNSDISEEENTILYK